MSKRIDIILPDETVAVLEKRVATKGNRSRFIDRAVRTLVGTEGRANLRARLKEEAIVNTGRDLAMAAEWFPVEEEAWQTFENTARKPPRETKRSSRK